MSTYRTSTRDIEIGSRLDIPMDCDGRGVIVTDNRPDGLSVIWYDRLGQGPYHAVLPHGKVGATRYHDERNVDQHYTETNADFTGKYRVF